MYSRAKFIEVRKNENRCRKEQNGTCQNCGNKKVEIDLKFQKNHLKLTNEMQNFVNLLI